MPIAIPTLIALLLQTALMGDVPTASPVARVATEPVSTDGDAADDPAIWLHPTDPARSLVLGTDKRGGLHTYGLDGGGRQMVSPKSRPNNVDLIYGVRIQGRTVDLAVASLRDAGALGGGIKVWTIDPADGALAEVAPGLSFKALGGTDPYGLCAYKSPRDGSLFVFVTGHDGKVEQHRLVLARDGTITAVLARTIAVGSQAEGVVADRERARLYVAEEDVAIWEFGAEPADGDARTAVAKVGQGGLTADIEGLTLYYAADGKGYLIASSQGANRYFVYDRAAPHALVMTIDPADGPLGDVSETDGIDVLNAPIGHDFPDGVFVVQDGTPGRRQRFKLFSWREIAGDRLLIDRTSDPRATFKSQDVTR